MANKIVSEDYADIIVQNRYLNRYTAAIDAVPLNSRVSMINVPISEIDMCSISEYSYRAFPFLNVMESTISLNESRIPNVQNQSNLALFGGGVLVAIIDTGIDYLHQAFRNADNTSCIHSIWDQTINEGAEIQETNNNTIRYGKEFTRDMINKALSSTNPLEIVPTRDEAGHGTAIAGIIAGRENFESEFRGVVPLADLVVVKLKQAKKINKKMFSIPEDVICYQDTDIILGINYVREQAELLNRPLAICIALGSNQGSHDGRGILSTYLSEIADTPGMCVVISAGNEGNGRRHHLGLLEGGTQYSEFEVRVGKDEGGFAMEIWKDASSRVSVDITSPTGEYIKPIFPTLDRCVRQSLIFSNTIVWVNNNLIENYSGAQLVLIRMDMPSEGLWKFRVYNLDNKTTNYHVWLPSEGIITDDTYFIDPNPDTTITSPGNSFYSLTITAYNHLNNSIYYTASRGLTRNGELKPDLAAPGVEITCPIAYAGYGTATGTGVAAAHATGITAMLLEWGIVRGNNVDLDGFGIKSMLIRGARRGPDDSVNNIWGYGRIDAYGVFEALTLGWLTLSKRS